MFFEDEFELMIHKITATSYQQFRTTKHFEIRQEVHNSATTTSITPDRFVKHSLPNQSRTPWTNIIIGKRFGLQVECAPSNQI